MWYTQASEHLKENINNIISSCKYVNKEVEDHLMSEIGIQREDVQDLLSWWFHSVPILHFRGIKSVQNLFEA